ncbi:MAG TPA: hypothetical protein VLF95_10035 [Vicinamibacteria bacterium]|nr:hypothetical protein [Vicinamibacteria bacterium]
MAVLDQGGPGSLLDLGERIRMIAGPLNAVQACPDGAPAAARVATEGGRLVFTVSATFRLAIPGEGSGPGGGT